MRSLKILVLFFLGLSVLLTSCQKIDSGHAATITQSVTGTSGETNRYSGGEIVPNYPYCNSVEAYQAFWDDKICPVQVLNPHTNELFGEFVSFIAYSYDPSNYWVEYEFKNREEQYKTTLTVYSSELFDHIFASYSNTPFVEPVDMAEDLSRNPYHYWMEIAESEEAFAEIYSRYYSEGCESELFRYQLCDKIIAYYKGTRDFYGINIDLGEYVVVLEFSVHDSSHFYSHMSDSNIIKQLFTKNTSKEVAESFCTDFKNALK